MIDASAGFMKDGNKNRLRSMDIHKIVDVFNRRLELPKYSRVVPFEEIEKNEFNLNIPRYIDSQQAEDIQDIEGHLRGGIPAADVDALQRYWDICPQLRQALFKVNRPGYIDLAIAKESIKSLTESEIKTIVVNDKWLAALDAAIHGEMDGISQALTQRVKEVAERYETPLPHQSSGVAELEQAVSRHLEKMGFSWS